MLFRCRPDSRFTDRAKTRWAWGKILHASRAETSTVRSQISLADSMKESDTFEIAQRGHAKRQVDLP
jgi:hypothetical protein